MANRKQIIGSAVRNAKQQESGPWKGAGKPSRKRRNLMTGTTGGPSHQGVVRSPNRQQETNNAQTHNKGVRKSGNGNIFY